MRTGGFLVAALGGLVIAAIQNGEIDTVAELNLATQRRLSAVLIEGSSVPG